MRRPRDVRAGPDVVEAASLVGGGDGDDLLAGGGGTDAFVGGAGRDAVSYAASGAVRASLDDDARNRGDAGGDTFDGIEHLHGSDGDDMLEGDSGANELRGGAGDDRLRGGDGDDTLDGGAGADRLDGVAGDDWAAYDGDRGVRVDLTDADRNTGDAEGDRLISIENLRGSDKRDVLVGDADGNHLIGGGGRDRLLGGDGRDTLDGGAGGDRLTGGGGRDVFVILPGGGKDRIEDFGRADRLDLSAYGLSDGAAEDDWLGAVRAAVQKGDHVHLDLRGGGSVRLMDTDLATLDDGDMIF